MARRGKEMDEKDEDEEEEEGGTEQPWGTLEELLLACAVNRHGAKSWDSIAMELQSRTSHRHLRAVFSPPNCKRRYHDLRRRFSSSVDGGGGGDDDAAMVDELKKLRVAELRREVERRDVSIEFLESKVKRLEEEREQRFKPKEEVVKREGTDLPDEPADREPEGNSRRERSVSGDDDFRSFNESNSTSDQKGESRAENGDKMELNHKPDAPDKPQSIGIKPEFSEPVAVQTGSNPVPVPNCSLNFEEGTTRRNNIEAQSSRKKKRRRTSSSSGEEGPEGGKLVQAKQIAIKSQPLINILAMLRSHKNGSLFERRLRSQETEKYKKMIRQHMDLKTVQSRLDKGFYLHNSRHRFFRDLLLLFTNAVVFFPTTSPHHTAAVELRLLVSKQMATTLLPTPPKPDPDQKQPDPVHSRPSKAAVKLKQPDNNKPGKPDPDKKQPGPPNKTVVTKQHPSRILTGGKALEEKSIKKLAIKERPELSRRSGRVGSDLLKRMKQKSPPKEVEDDSSDDDEDDDVETEKEKKGRGGGDRSGRGKKPGRPPKRSPVRRELRSDGGRGKRRRDGGEVAAAATVDQGRPKKRSKR